MGNFSRDTFDSIKQYVNVLLPQGVPLVDADINEMNAIRRHEFNTFVQRFIGDGVPSNNYGFKIEAEVDGQNENNFKIKAGLCLVDGLLVENPQDLSFNAQPLHSKQEKSAQDLLTAINKQNQDQQISLIEMPGAPNSPPPTYAVLVYLDIWEWEVGKDDEIILFPDKNYREAKGIVNPNIGIETCLRTRREWAVRARIGNELPMAASPDYLENHSYYAIASINRRVGDSLIKTEDITDLRRSDLTLAKTLYERGIVDTIDNQSFAALLDRFRRTLYDRQETQSLFLQLTASDHDRNIIHFSIQHISQICVTGSLLAKTKNLNNYDCLQVLSNLHNAQDELLSKITKYISVDDTDKNSFIADYRTRLNIIGSSLSLNDMGASFLAQKEVDSWLRIGFDIATFLTDNQQQLTGRIKQLIFPGSQVATPESETVKMFLRYLNNAFIKFIAAFKGFNRKELGMYASSDWKEQLLKTYINLEQGTRAITEIKNSTGTSTLSDSAKQLASLYFDFFMEKLK